MVFLSGLDVPFGKPIPNAVRGKIANPVRTRIANPVKATIAKPVPARIANPVPANIATLSGIRPYLMAGLGEGEVIYGRGIPPYVPTRIANPVPATIATLSGRGPYVFAGLGADEAVFGRPIPPAVPARIANAVKPEFATPSNGQIPPMVPTRIGAGPTGAITGSIVGGNPVDAIPFKRSIGLQKIYGPTSYLPAFPVPGAGEEATSLGPQAVTRAPSASIKSMTELMADNPKAAALSYVTSRLGPLLDALAELPANERGPALRTFFDLYNQPDAEPAVRRLTAEFIAKGTQPQIAFRAALARVIATAALFVSPTQVLAAGVDDDDDDDDDDNDSVSGFGAYSGLGAEKKKKKKKKKSAWQKLGGFVKKVGRAVVKVVHKAADLVEDVACSAAGKMVADKVGEAFGAPPGAGGAAACTGAKTLEYATAELAHAVGVKKKNPSFLKHLKEAGGELVSGAKRAQAAAGGSNNLFTQIKLPESLQKVADDVRAKVDNSKILTVTAKEIAEKVPAAKNLSKGQLDVVVTQIADRFATPEAYGDKDDGTVALGARPAVRKQSPVRREKFRMPKLTDAQREKAKQASSSYWQSNQESVAKPVAVAPVAAPKTSQVPLVLGGVVAVGALLYVLNKRKAV